MIEFCGQSSPLSERTWTASSDTTKAAATTCTSQVALRVNLGKQEYICNNISPSRKKDFSLNQYTLGSCTTQPSSINHCSSLETYFISQSGCKCVSTRNGPQIWFLFECCCLPTGQNKAYGSHVSGLSLLSISPWLLLVPPPLPVLALTEMSLSRDCSYKFTDNID